MNRPKLAQTCRQLVAEDRGRAAAEAVHWLKTYCRHWATVGHDTQTIDNLNAAERITARQHLGTLRRIGKLREGGFRGNFEVL
jgi:kynurenine formamidase